MNADATYDTLEQARKLKDVGFEDDQAEAFALCLRDAARFGRDDLAKSDIVAVKSDFVAFEARMDARIAELRSSMYRALWLQGAGIIAIMTALRLIPAG